MARVLARLGFVLSALVLCALALAQEITADQKKEILKGIEETILTRAFVPGVDFKKWAEFVAKRQEQIDEAGDEQSFGRVINQALRDFGFSHIRLANPRSTALRGQTSTVGAGAAVVPSEEGLAVRRVVDRGPAKDLGLETGDVITKIDGVKPTSPDDLNGEEGTKKSIEIKKASGEVKVVELEIKRFSTVREETLEWVDEETAVLRVYTFSTGYSRRNVEDLMDQASKAKNLVLDLRSNGGGAVFNLNHLLGLLLPDKSVIGTFVNRRLADEYLAELPGATPDAAAIAKWTDRKSRSNARGREPFAGKIAVLLNRGSASASEIVAAALKENLGALFVGTRSAGAVLASTFARLPDGWSIQYPVSDFVTGKGVRIEGNPLLPDVEVAGRPTPEDRDPGVTSAVKALKGTKAA